MKFLIGFVAALLFCINLNGQEQPYNTENGYVANGYDVVLYFENKAEPGNKKYVAIHDGVKFKFKNEASLATFRKNPTKYIPQYGGWCAYAMVSGKKVKINPKTFEVREGKLYLFYNKYFTNTLDSWIEKMPNKLIPKANNNWEKLSKS